MCKFKGRNRWVWIKKDVKYAPDAVFMFVAGCNNIKQMSFDHNPDVVRILSKLKSLEQKNRLTVIHPIMLYKKIRGSHEWHLLVANFSFHFNIEFSNIHIYSFNSWVQVNLRLIYLIYCNFQKLMITALFFSNAILKPCLKEYKLHTEKVFM